MAYVLPADLAVPAQCTVNPFTESPAIPYTRRTPEDFSAATMTSLTVLAMVCPFRGYAAAQNA